MQSLAGFAREGERWTRPLTHALAGHLHEAQGRNLGDLMTYDRGTHTPFIWHEAAWTETMSVMMTMLLIAQAQADGRSRRALRLLRVTVSSERAAGR